nr:hypothetical protein CFP56_32166 [Quercus suber]
MEWPLRYGQASQRPDVTTRNQLQRYSTQTEWPAKATTAITIADCQRSDAFNIFTCKAQFEAPGRGISAASFVRFEACLSQRRCLVAYSVYQSESCHITIRRLDADTCGQIAEAPCRFARSFRAGPWQRMHPDGVAVLNVLRTGSRARNAASSIRDCAKDDLTSNSKRLGER